MLKKLLPVSILILFLLILSTSNTTFATYSPSNDNTNSAQDNIKNSNNKLKDLNNQLLDINHQISQLNSQVNKLNVDITKNNNDITKSENEIGEAQTKIDILKKEITDNQKLADERVRAMYRCGGSVNYVSLIISSKGFSDLLSRVEAAERIASYDKKLLSDLNTKKEVLRSDLADLNKKNLQLQQLKNNNLTALNQLNDKKKQLNDLASQFNKEKEKAAADIQNNLQVLVKSFIADINSAAASIGSLEIAIDGLKQIIPQITLSSVKYDAQDYVSKGREKLNFLRSNPPSRGGTGTYLASYTMNSTAYTGGGITASGLKPVRDPDGLSTIAVDPSVIPLGTKVYIPGYGYAICADTGGAIKGNIIDVYLNSEDDCYNWGRRTVTVNIIAYP